MGKGITFVNGDGVANTISNIEDNTGGTLQLRLYVLELGLGSVIDIAGSRSKIRLN
jgi:hypothetical protein